MNIMGELQKIGIVLADDGLVTVLEKVPLAAVPAVEVDHVADEKLLHAGCKRPIARPCKQMEMFGIRAQA
jgi:hypothetical protein